MLGLTAILHATGRTGRGRDEKLDEVVKLCPHWRSGIYAYNCQGSMFLLSFHQPDGYKPGLDLLFMFEGGVAGIMRIMRPRPVQSSFRLGQLQFWNSR